MKVKAESNETSMGNHRIEREIGLSSCTALGLSDCVRPLTVDDRVPVFVLLLSESRQPTHLQTNQLLQKLNPLPPVADCHDVEEQQ